MTVGKVIDVDFKRECKAAVVDGLESAVRAPTAAELIALLVESEGRELELRLTISMMAQALYAPE